MKEDDVKTTSRKSESLVRLRFLYFPLLNDHTKEVFTRTLCTNNRPPPVLGFRPPNFTFTKTSVEDLECLPKDQNLSREDVISSWTGGT